MKLSAEDAFRQFGDRVFSAAFSATGNKEDADDVVQDTFLKYWDTDQDFTDENHIKAWLLRVAIDNFGREWPLTDEELLEEISSNVDVEYKDDGTVWVYYQDQAMEITDLFDENKVCYVQIKTGTETIYVTVKYGGSFSWSSFGYVQPEEFSD